MPEAAPAPKYECPRPVLRPLMHLIQRPRLCKLFDTADQVHTVDEKRTRVEPQSGSQRTQRTTPLSGFFEKAAFVAETRKPFASLLAWIPFIQVGKDIVEGNGRVRITTST